MAVPVDIWKMRFLPIVFTALFITHAIARQDLRDGSRRYILGDFFHPDLDKIPDEWKKLECTLCKCEKECHAALFDYKESEVCNPFMDSISCSDPMNFCASSPCKNGAVCVNKNNTYACQCKTGWTGINCDSAVVSGPTVDHCSSNPCTNGGTCNNGPDGYTCQCQAGLTGHNCEKQLNTNLCTNATCLHGSCTLNNGSYRCSCDQGWKGNQCQTEVNECDKHPCQHGGKCSNSVGGYSCSCTSGWTGSDCIQDVDECTRNPCSNQTATCLNTDGSYSCQCSSGWTGSKCETDIDECVMYRFCHNGATCLNTLGGFSCSCASGWNGTQCQTDVNECTNNPCKHGSCTNTRGSYSCVCSPGWIGSDCDTDGQPKECNHICTLESVVKQTPVSYNNASTCPGSSIYASNEELLRQCCQLGEQSTWTTGLEVMPQCNSGTIKPYTPIFAYKNGMIEPDTAGVLTACLQDGTGFIMIRQGCTSTPHVYNVNGTSNGNVDSDPANYFVIL